MQIWQDTRSKRHHLASYCILASFVVYIDLLKLMSFGFEILVKKKGFIYKGTELTVITLLNSCDRKKNSILIYKVDK